MISIGSFSQGWLSRATMLLGQRSSYVPRASWNQTCRRKHLWWLRHGCLGSCCRPLPHLFFLGGAWLVSMLVDGGGFLARWKKEGGDGRLLASLEASEPVPWMDSEIWLAVFLEWRKNGKLAGWSSRGHGLAARVLGPTWWYPFCRYWDCWNV